MSSTIQAVKLVKSWYETVIKKEKPTKPSEVQPDTVQHWVDTISKSPKLLLALQNVL